MRIDYVMNLDFGKPFNGFLARLNIASMVFAWGRFIHYRKELEVLDAIQPD